jgi:hypothetical protein
VVIPENVKSIGQNAFKGCTMVPEGYERCGRLGKSALDPKIGEIK